jgi:hypothetical protein|tara:strand:- start:87 stop:314 length:228 start_codon:yes stop_codon:yes gene_type:complete
MTIKKNVMKIKLNETPGDCIVRFIGEGHSDEGIYKFLLNTCSRSFKNKQDRQDVADQIAQVRSLDVFAESDLEIA